MQADLILLNANPLDDITHLGRAAGVSAAGQWLAADDIEAGFKSFTGEWSHHWKRRTSAPPAAQGAEPAAVEQ